jgi:hypothetical protein
MALLSRCTGARTTAALALAILLCARPMAQQAEAGEQVIKAAYLYNFTKFIDWPESAFAEPSAPFAVCVLADTMFHDHVAAIMHNEQVRGRPVVVRRPAAPHEVAACHMAYFSRTEAERTGKHLAELGQSPILTGGEGQRFMQLGGHIAFHLEHDRVRFTVSRTRAEAASLSISSKLLRVAKNVE